MNVRPHQPRSRLVLALAVALLLPVVTAPAHGQVHSRRADEAGFVGGKGSANFLLAERFAPYNVRDMVYSLSVTPRWIEGSEKFWYEW